MVSWIFAATAAGFAFLLSFLVGLVSGVSFGALLLRAVFAGLFFALLSLGAEQLLRTLIPDLLPQRLKGDDEDSPEAETDSTGAAVDITLDDHQVEGEAPPPGLSTVETADGFIEEIHGDSPAGLAFTPPVADVGEVEELETIESMDDLPNLDGFSDAFESDYGAGGTAESSDGKRQADVDIMGEAQDAEEVVKAVKTMMKRDQEG